MSDLSHNLKREFQDPAYRYAYAESFLNTKLAAQIKVLREARGKTQQELALCVGTKQSGFSRFEDVNHSGWKTGTLWRIARALGVRLAISFETFGSLIDEKERFSRQSLERPDFANDPTFSATGLGHAEILVQPSQIYRQPEADGALMQDADGSPRAYNAGGPGNWRGIVIDDGEPSGNPVIQGAYRGYNVSTTSLERQLTNVIQFPPQGYSERLGSALSAAAGF